MQSHEVLSRKRKETRIGRIGICNAKRLVMTDFTTTSDSNSLLPYPLCAKPGSISDHLYDDFDRQSERLSGYNQEYFQLSKGQFRGRFLSVEFGSTVSFHLEVANQKLQQLVGFPSDKIALGLVFSNGGAFHVNGMEMTTRDIMVCRPGGEMNMISPCGGTIMAICFPKAGLENHSVGEGFLKPSENLPSSVSLFDMPDLAHRLREDALAAIESIQRAEEGMLNHDIEVIGRTFLSCILGQIELHLSSTIPGVARSRCYDYDVFKSIHGVLSSSGSPLDYSTLMKTTDLSKRTLQLAVSKYVDMTPTQYSRALRPNMARRVLTRGLKANETIGDVAQHHGFFGWSRFTKHYQELFGELPSEARQGS